MRRQWWCVTWQPRWGTEVCAGNSNRRATDHPRLPSLIRESSAFFREGYYEFPDSRNRTYQTLICRICHVSVRKGESLKNGRWIRRWSTSVLRIDMANGFQILKIIWRGPAFAEIKRTWKRGFWNLWGLQNSQNVADNQQSSRTHGSRIRRVFWI